MDFIKKRKYWIISFSILILFILAFLHFVIGWHHVPHHVRDLYINAKYGLERKMFGTIDGTPISNWSNKSPSNASIVDVVQMPIQEPLDTLYWGKKIRANENVSEVLIQDYESYKSTDFSQMVLAKNKPTNLEAEEAIINYYKQEMVVLLESNDAHIRIGQAYEAPLNTTSEGNVETAHVTAMVCAFNSANKNLRNIQHPLLAVYDFVKYEKDTVNWYIQNFSQTIPYDYELNKGFYQ